MSNRLTENFPIRTVSALTGVNAITLRAWERRYGLVKPHRTATGHRLYSAEQVELIRRVVALTEQGIPIGRVRDALGTAVEKRASGDPWREPVERMASAITRFDEDELELIYDEALAVHPVERVTRELMLPVLKRLGERWTKVPGAIAEEHFFAAYVRSKLGARLLTRMRYTAGPRIVAACFPGEQHEIGLMLFAVEARAAGLRIVLLGADMPLEEVAIAARNSGCDGLVLSMCVDPSPGILEKRLPALVRDAGVPVFVGGTMVGRHPRAFGAAGAIPLLGPLENGVRLVCATLESERKRR